LFVHLDDTRQLGLDCFAFLSARRGIAFGWTMLPRGIEGSLDIVGGAGAPCPILHAGFHERPDVPIADPAQAVVQGFILVFELPDGAEQPVIALAAGDAVLRAEMRHKEVERSLPKAIAERDWGLNLALLREAATVAELAPLMTHQGRPFGAFADWLAAMPVVRGRAANHGRIAEAEALQAASGELLVMLRAAAGLPPHARIDAAAIGWVRSAPGAAARPRLLPFAEWHGARLPVALAGYGRLGGPLADRVQALEIIIHAEPEPGEEVWLRCYPISATIPDLLDAACRGTAPSLAMPVEAAGSAGLALLREVITRREAAFAPMLAGMAGVVAAPAAAPRTALLLGADDAAAARLFHVTAEAFARHCDRLLVMGAAADDVAQALAPLGRPEVLVGEAAADALRAASGTTGVLALDAADFARAVIADAADGAFAHALSGAELAQLLALHAVAGCAPSLADSLQRLLRGRRGQAGGQRFAPVARAWSNRHAAEPVHVHLERLWSAGATAAPRGVEPALHG
jgi:hypothetical protein